jgi:ribosomal peptide maturation radical SAM protein 1
MGTIVLVVPPWQSVTTPALGVSLLQANLQVHAVACEVLYLNLHFADRIGLSAYHQISERTTTLLGDFLFSHLLFDRTPDATARYIADVLEHDDLGRQLSQVLPAPSLHATLDRLIRAAADWIDEAIDLVVDRDPWMVGFSSTFQQNCASLALMRRIKAVRPGAITVIGGANCSGDMGEELFARFPEIDYLGQGECDHSFIELVTALRAGTKHPSVQGFLSRAGGAPPVESAPAPASAVVYLSRAGATAPRESSLLQGDDLDGLPYPTFDDYFAQLRTASFANRVLPALVMETSRGCWWGAKHHCTFCGLNAEGMGFRAKSGLRAFEEMAALVARYGINRIAVVDNILDMKYFTSVLPRLEERPIAEMFYEIKSNLTKAQVRSLARAKITWIQPGIESLSDRTLAIMRKGVTKLQNIQLLKWCAENGIHVGWNHLFGFPGEDEGELDQIAEDAAAIVHLEPPFGTSVLHMDRFSPYFNDPDAFGLSPVRSARPYSHVYPFPEESLRRLAYFYDSEVFERKKQSPAFARLKAVTEGWQRSHYFSHLVSFPRSRGLYLFDTRPCAGRLVRRLRGLERRVYEKCDKAETLGTIVASLGADVNTDAVHAILETFVDDKLMLHSDGRYLSLATDARAGYRRYGQIPPLGSVLSPGFRDTVQRLMAAGSPGAWTAALGRAARGGVRRAVIHCAARTIRWQNKCLRRLARLGAPNELTT